MAFTDRETFWNADPAVCRTALLRTLRGRMRIGQLAIRALQYAWDTFRSLFSERGFVVTFSGVDGAGKSTVIAHVKEELERTFRREVVLMRHRPGLLPMLNAWRVGRANAERMATIAPPRKGGNTSVMGSILRFAYYYVDYLVGQWYVHLRHVMRGRVVLYDRYYFDFMADPRRSNLHLDPRPLRVLYRFVHKPRLNFFLYADSGTILQRKRELDKAEVELLTDRYLRLFQGLGHRGVRGRYITLRNDDLQRTLRGIRAEYARVA
jgi:thymidylate kinase